MTLFYVISLCILLILPKGSIADCSPACIDPQVCDSDNNCKLNVDGDCTPPTTTDCKTGLVCEANKCLIDVGGSCAGANSTKCKTGLTCEADKCMIDVGGSCAGANSTKCKTGLTCEANTCTVTHDTYGGACTNPTGGPDSCVAKDSNAVCTGNKCECKPGYSATIGTKCSGVAGLTCSLFLLGIVLLVSKYFQ